MKGDTIHTTNVVYTNEFIFALSPKSGKGAGDMGLWNWGAKTEIPAAYRVLACAVHKVSTIFENFMDF